MKKISRRDLLKGFAAGAATLTLSGLSGKARAASGARPNVLFILADDLGWADTRLYGSKYYETPHIDALARRGMMFTQAYAAAPLCSATRCSIMSGQWPARVGITGASCHLPEVRLTPQLAKRGPAWQKALSCVEVDRLDQKYVTLAEAMKAGGYRTGHFGKWHLGLEPYDPQHQGFDVDLPHWWGPGPAGSYVAPWKFPPQVGFKPETPAEHIEDRMAREAVRFIKESKAQGTPFFLNYWAFSVHAPFDAKQAYIETYRLKADPNNPQRCPVYAAMVKSLDEAVGTLMKTLDEEGLAENTIVIFTSDNGGNMYDRVNGITPTSNAPLRGGKATLYEGGVREPLVVIWPGRVAPGAKNEKDIVQSIDFYPTLLEMCGVARPEGCQKLDGMSIMPALTGGRLTRDTIFGHFPHNTPATGQIAASYVRQGDWKLIRFYCDGPSLADRHELYNLKEDLGEQHDLAAQMPEKVLAMSALIDGFLKESGAVIPTANPAYDPKAVAPPPGKPAGKAKARPAPGGPKGKKARRSVRNPAARPA